MKDYTDRIARAGVSRDLQKHMQTMSEAKQRACYGASYNDLREAARTNTEHKIHLNLPAISYRRFKRLYDMVVAEGRKEAHT
jgi:hypothetical protein